MSYSSKRILSEALFMQTAKSNAMSTKQLILMKTLLIFLLHLHSSNSLSCGLTDEQLFPKEIGSINGETIVTAMDFQVHPSLANYERMAFGG